jgi:hypothetical protein
MPSTAHPERPTITPFVKASGAASQRELVVASLIQRPDQSSAKRD